MPRRQVITLTCQYSRYNQDFACRLPECFPQRSQIQQQEYVVHGIPKRLHCRPRIRITPSKFGNNYFGCGRSPKMDTETSNVIKVFRNDEAKPVWSELKMKLQYFRDKHGTSTASDTLTGQAPLVNTSEKAKDGNCHLQFEMCAEAAGPNCGQHSIAENNSCAHLEEDAAGNQMSDTCTDQESKGELTAKNITPPNSPNCAMESAEGLTTFAVLEHSLDKEHSLNGIHVIDENAVCDDLEASDKSPASWYHKLVQLELENKILQVPKPENTYKTQLPRLYKCQMLTPHFASYETSESRRISRTERHVQYLILKKNSAKPREKLKHVRRPRKPAA